MPAGQPELVQEHEGRGKAPGKALVRRASEEGPRLPQPERGVGEVLSADILRACEFREDLVENAGAAMLIPG